MAQFIAKRFLYTILVLWLASVVVFLALRITPGDPSNFVENPLQTEERKAQIRAELGLDRPLLDQYGSFVSGVVTWDFGRSFIRRQPITEVVNKGLPKTLELAGAALLIVLVIGIPLGMLSALKRGKVADHAIAFLASLGMGIPNFVLALVLIRIFAIDLGWLPAAGTGGIAYLVLPAVVLALEPLAVTMRLMRSSTLDQLGLEYVRTLRAKGLSRRRITGQHVMRNSLGPIITLTAVQLRTLLGYTLIVEVIFRWPGLGSELVNAVLTRDFPLAQSLALLLTFAVILLSFAADVGLAVADPRVRRRAA